MAPIRKSRSLSMISLSKDAENIKKSLQRKRKFSDMLGSRWSKEELELFYEAYRKYGKDWRKVAAEVPNRSVDMVEALYMMNKAYLSLPEGIASAVGFFAMMTDHYCNLVESNRDPEGGETCLNSQKKLKSHLVISASKKPSGGTQPQINEKGKPCSPVLYSDKSVGGGKFSSPINSQLSNKRTGKVILLPTWNGERMGTELKSTSARYLSDTDGDGLERGNNVQNLDTNYGVKNYLDAIKESSSVSGTRYSGIKPGKIARHIAKKNSKKAQGLDVGSIMNEAMSRWLRPSEIHAILCNYSHFSINVEPVDFPKAGTIILFDRNKLRNFRKDGHNWKKKQDGKTVAETHEHLKVGNEKKIHVYYAHGEDNPTFTRRCYWLLDNALEDIVLVHYRDTREETSTTSGFPKSSPGLSGPSIILSDEADSVRDPVLYTHENSQLDEGSAFEALQALADLSLRISTTGNESTVHFEEEKGNQSGASVGKTPYLEEGSGLDNNGILIAETLREEFHTLTRQSDSQEAEASYVRNVTSKGRDNPCNISWQNQGRKFITYTKRRKALQKPQNLKNLKENDMLNNCLSSKQLRRWCVFEWFYSAIDYPWFARREFVEYLKHVGLDHVPRLNRTEWDIIKSSLGKPRRFSEQFLKEEKESLSRYRDSVRKCYNELNEGVTERLPVDIPRALSVGQRVMAIHPKRREISDGIVSSVEYNRFRVQFDRPELGVEFVQDIDCRPLNPLENMPVSLPRKTATRNELFTSFYEIKTGEPAKSKQGGDDKKSFGEILEFVDMASHLSPACNSSKLTKEVKGIRNDSYLQDKAGIGEYGKGQQVVYSALLAQMQAKEDDKQSLSEMTCILKKKETLVFELQSINDVIEHRSNSVLSDSEMKKQYASVLLQLDSVNGQISSVLRDFRQHNTNLSSLHLSPNTQKL